MSDFTVDTRQLDRLKKSLTAADKSFAKGVKKLLVGIGVYVQGLAREYCPESPTLADYASMNKSGTSKRKHLSTGSLRDSITMKAKKRSVSVFVPSNSRGGKYAEKIHDKKNVTWRKRGVRTKQKGPKADEKFIFRAYDDSQDKLDEQVDHVIDIMTKEIIR